MSKITSKLQITVPKILAEQYGLAPGSEVVFEPMGPVIVLRPLAPRAQLTLEERLSLFDAASRRVHARPAAPARSDRGWTREELYDRVPR